MAVSSIVRGTSLSLAFALGIALVTASAASARTITLRWQHPDAAEVVGFRAHFGSQSRGATPYGNEIDLGKPGSSGGVFATDIQVPDHTVFVSLTAYDGQGSSAFSNEKIYEGVSAPPPNDPPPGGSAQGEITGFALWNAATDTLIDGDFRDGEKIYLADNDCVAIEVLTNGYLDTGGTPGSVKLGFDGAVPTTCDEPGYTHENNPPYAWELDVGPQSYECAASLSIPGSHTLGALAFDGDNCTGAVGNMKIVTFEVISGGGTGAPPLGQPGQPILID